MRNRQKNIFVPTLQLCALLIFSFFSFHTFGQLKRYPLPRKNTNQTITPATAKSKAARTQGITPLTLPFWDDFSTTTTGSPDTNRWQFSNSVWINNGMGINEPSINVATFDGLDSTNLAYNPNQTLVNGFTDKLISKPIDLSIVPLDHRDSVYLSFFYQWQGNGEAPDKNDYLSLDFKAHNSIWHNIMTIHQKANPDPTIFYDTIVQISDTSYFHNAFQFRFQRFGRESGPFDTWNVDYIYLNQNRTIHDVSYPDRAAASGISPLFGDYYGTPIKHFFATKKIDSVTFDVQNLKDISLTAVSYKSTITSKKFYSDPDIPVIYSKNIIHSHAINKNGGLQGPFERTIVRLDTLPDPNDKLLFDSLATSIQIKLKMKVISGDSLDIGRSKFAPINLQVNDTISAFYTLKNYYAYDDGVAEYSVGLTQAGNLVAYEFDMATPKPDTLTGFDAYFPDFALASSQTVDFYVYGDNGAGLPGPRLGLLSGKPLSLSGGLNNFQSILFNQAIVVQGKFYIGWKEPQTGHIKVGLDASNDTFDKMFVNVTNAWVQNDEVHGSMMIRPKFGYGGVISGVPPVVEEKDAIQVYPNPNNGTFFINGQYDRLHVTTMTGQQVSFLSEDTGIDKKITLQATSPGLYIVQLYKGKNWEAKKIIVR